MNTFPELPDFLRLDPSDRGSPSWKGRKLTRQGAGFKPPPSKQEEAATRQLRKELEKQAEAKKAARFAALKEMKARK